MKSHEYVLLDGVSRAKIGRYLGIIAAAASAGIVFVVLRLVDLASKFGIPANLTPSVMSLVGAGAVYTFLYWIFDRHIWRLPLIGRLLNVPDLQGHWKCTGISYGAQDNPGPRPWIGDITISQSWDRLRIRLKTEKSGSSSVVAALMHDDAGGYQLFYNYENDPRVDQPELHHHVGFCHMAISRDQHSAEGDYFTGRGRSTYGTMNWNRSK